MRFLSIILTIFLAGCAVNTGRVAVIQQDGKILTGSYTASLAGGSVLVTNGGISCSGTYNSLDTSTTITMPIFCNDGRKGFAIVTRQANQRDGFGKIIFSDGSQADGVFGSAANAF
jgi:hypothetical protein